MWLGHRVAAQVISLTLNQPVGPFLLLFLPLLALLAVILDLSMTTTPILPFGACYVIMHKVYFSEKWASVGEPDAHLVKSQAMSLSQFVISAPFILVRYLII